MTAYYNEWEPYPAQWLRNLIKAGLIAHGDVDERSIKDVKADDLKGYTQCHFFAGIGGWSYALRLAGWDDDRRVWTGSCPCQPFSCSGKQAGTSDERHLWPVWKKLIKECKPTIIFGEQVAAAVKHGWLDGVYSELEECDYAIGSAVLPACSVDAPHERGRLYFVADGFDDDTTMRRAQEVTKIHERVPTKCVEHSETSFWVGHEWFGCDDGKRRRVPSTAKSGIQLMANGFPNRMAAIHGAGNAIVPQVAQAFIEAFMEVRP